MSADASGLEAAYRDHRGELLRFLIARTGDQAEAEDVLQDLWFRLRQPASGPVANARAYLYRMAQNLVIDRRREQAARARRERRWSDAGADGAVAIEPIDPEPTAEEAALAREEAATLASAIATLPPAAREALRLHKLEGLSHPEVAARLGISRSGVEKHMAVAMKFLRRALCD